MVNRFILCTFAVLMCAINSSAQTNDTATLTVLGTGETLEIATTNALRSAIEQTYGVFVSANTQILNDELIKDEIATITSGNIHSYKILSSSILPDGQHSVSISAEVSIVNLQNFAKSKGSACELSGSTFMQNVKLRELNKQNEETALKNLIDHVAMMAPGMFEYELEIGDHRQASEPFHSSYNEEPGVCIPFKISIYPTEKSKHVVQLIQTTLDNLSLSTEEINEYKRTHTGFSGITMPRSLFKYDMESGELNLDGHKYFDFWMYPADDREGKLIREGDLGVHCFRSDFIHETLNILYIIIANEIQNFKVVETNNSTIWFGGSNTVLMRQQGYKYPTGIYNAEKYMKTLYLPDIWVHHIPLYRIGTSAHHPGNNFVKTKDYDSVDSGVYIRAFINDEYYVYWGHTEYASDSWRYNPFCYISIEDYHYKSLVGTLYKLLIMANGGDYYTPKKKKDPKYYAFYKWDDPYMYFLFYFFVPNSKMDKITGFKIEPLI